MLIEVTESHIAAGKRQSCFSCPIALATGGFVTLGYILVNKLRYRVPGNVVEWMKDYDEEKEVRPISFYLERL